MAKADVTDLDALYLIHTQVVGIGEHPFLGSAVVRPIWRHIFNNKNCFSDNKDIIVDDSVLCKRFALKDRPGMRLKKTRRHKLAMAWSDDPAYIGDLPMPSSPFIRSLGSVCFNTRRVHKGTYSLRRQLAFNFCNKNDTTIGFNDADYDSSDLEGYDGYLESDDDIEVFGFDPSLEDQRMNCLPFELSKPVILYARTNSDIKATAKFFLHVYPCGYLVLHYAISCSWSRKRTLGDIRIQIINQTRPHHTSSSWSWRSRLDKDFLSLDKVTSKIYSHIEASLFSDSAAKLCQPNKCKWYSLVRFTAPVVDYQAIATELLGSRSEPTLVDNLSFGDNRSGADKFLTTSQGAVCLFKTTLAKYNQIQASFSSSLQQSVNTISDLIGQTEMPDRIRGLIQDNILALPAEIYDLDKKPSPSTVFQIRIICNNVVAELGKLEAGNRQDDQVGELNMLDTKRSIRLLELARETSNLEYLINEMSSAWAKPQSARRFLWKVCRIYEFSLLKAKIYRDYTGYMENEIKNLKKNRRNIFRSFSQEDILRAGVFDEQASDFYDALKSHVDQTHCSNAFYRRLYSACCIVCDVNKNHQAVDKLLEEWDDESKLWKHPFQRLLNSILSFPLSKAFKGK